MRSALSFFFASFVLSLGVASSGGCSSSGATSAAGGAGATGANDSGVPNPIDGGHPDPPLPADEGAAIYVGIESDDFGAAKYTSFTNVVVTTTVDGLAPRQQTLGFMAVPGAIKITTTKENPNAQLDVKVEGQAPGSMAGSTETVITRLATTHFVPGQTMLLRLHLDAQCATDEPQLLPGQLPPPLGPTCAAPLTCRFGACKDSTVSPDQLEPYDSAWASHEPDGCRTSSSVMPEIVVGTGQSDFTALADGATVTPTLGPQGGYMVLVAVQTKSVGQNGTMTTISGAQPGSTLIVPPSTWLTSYTPADAGTCGLYGLRLVLVNGLGSTPTIADWVNKPLDITVDVVDTYGSHLTETKRVIVAQP